MSLAPSLTYQLKRASVLKRCTDSSLRRRSKSRRRAEEEEEEENQGDLERHPSIRYSGASSLKAGCFSDAYHFALDEERFHPPTCAMTSRRGLAPRASMAPSESRHERYRSWAFCSDLEELLGKKKEIKKLKSVFFYSMYVPVVHWPFQQRSQHLEILFAPLVSHRPRRLALTPTFVQYVRIYQKFF